MTGATGSIGQAIAYALAGRGFPLVIHAHRNRDGLEKVAENLRSVGKRVETITSDVSDRSTTREVILGCIERLGPFWGVVSNAGVHRDAPFPGLTDEDWDTVLGTNLDAFYNVLHPVTMPMIQRRDGGRIVTISSVAGITGNRGQVNYSAAKAGIIGATRALAQELAKRRIAVNSVAPGFIESEMVKNLPIDEIVPHIPMRRLGRPNEVGELVAFLFSDAAEYITGQVISINGGLI